MKSEKGLNIMKIIFYAVMTTAIIVLTFQWATLDTKLKEMEGVISTTLDKVQCNIDFKDFHYKGFCVRQDEAFNFIKTYYNTTENG